MFGTQSFSSLVFTSDGLPVPTDPFPPNAIMVAGALKINTVVEFDLDLNNVLDFSLNRNTILEFIVRR